MSTRNPAHVLRVPGHLIANPTNLNSVFPFGGTGLGVLVDHVLIPTQQAYLIRGEEYGGVPVEGVQGGEAWILAAALKSWDPTALAKFFPGLSTGAVTQHPVVSSPAGVGGKLSDRAFKLFFSPEDQDRHPSLIFYAVMGLVEESARIVLNEATNLSIPVVFHAILDSSERTVAWGMRQDLPL